jgi:hypothetical protein
VGPYRSLRPSQPDGYRWSRLDPKSANPWIKLTSSSPCLCEVLAWIHRSRRRSSPVTRRLDAPFRPQPRMRNLFSARSPPESQPAISLFFVPRGAILFSFLSSRLSQSAMGGELLSVASIDPLPIQEICQGVLAVARILTNERRLAFFGTLPICNNYNHVVQIILMLP